MFKREGTSISDDRSCVSKFVDTSNEVPESVNLLICINNAKHHLSALKPRFMS